MTNREKINQRMRETIAKYEAMSDIEFAECIAFLDRWYRISFLEIAQEAMGYVLDSSKGTFGDLLGWLQQEVNND